MKKEFKPMTKQHKIKETYKFTHKDISIYVKIDYLNNRIDIVEPVNLLRGNFKKSEFVFIGRGVEYMQGWRDILEAISEATKDAQAKYEANLALESSFRDKDMLSLLNKTMKTITTEVKGNFTTTYENGVKVSQRYENKETDYLCETTFNDKGDPLIFKNSDGNSYEYTYDEKGRAITFKNSEGDEYVYTYDDKGNQTEKRIK